MTERHEVQGMREAVGDVLLEVVYESETTGESDEFNSKMDEAAALLSLGISKLREAENMLPHTER